MNTTIMPSFDPLKEAFPNSVDVEFVIVVPRYKNEKWAVDNLHSACMQKASRPIQVICVNDASPDRTGEVMDNYVSEHNLESKVMVIHNEVNMVPLKTFIIQSINRFLIIKWLFFSMETICWPVMMFFCSLSGMIVIQMYG